MTITWLGHAAFLITTAEGRAIITDPYEAGAYGGALAYQPITHTADVVTVSHQHADHYHPQGIQGHPQIVMGAGAHQAGGFTIKGIAAFHDPSEGAERGDNTMFVFNVDGLSVCHFGDLGHIPDEQQMAELGHVDVALIPVGGCYTIDAREATQIIETLAPPVVIPMHYKTDACAFPIAAVDDFLRGKTHVHRPGRSELALTKDRLPATTHIYVLEHQL